jgi:hypothetical protein
MNNNQTIAKPYIQEAAARNLYPTVRYTSNWPWLWGAIVSLIFCVLCVLPSYHGFWKLGRKVTLGKWSRKYPEYRNTHRLILCRAHGDRFGIPSTRLAPPSCRYGG